MGSTGHLDVGTEVLRELNKGGPVGDQVALVMAVRKSPPLNSDNSI